MRRSALSFAICVLLAVLAAAGATTDPADTYELAGSYVLLHGEWEKVEATFVASGSDSWTVEFRFEFQGRSETWTGSAMGSLIEGPLEGTVQVEEMGRSFVFRGEVNDGVLEATHAETELGGETPTGTMTLGPVVENRE